MLKDHSDEILRRPKSLAEEEVQELDQVVLYASSAYEE